MSCKHTIAWYPQGLHSLPRTINLNNQWFVFSKPSIIRFFETANLFLQKSTLVSKLAMLGTLVSEVSCMWSEVNQKHQQLRHVV